MPVVTMHRILYHVWLKAVSGL